MAYGWAITKNHFDGQDEGVSNGPLSHDEIIKHKDREFFQMYTDDDELIYSGYIVQDDDSQGFEPLDDFGMPNFGCTYIKYRNPYTREMEVL